MPETLKGFKGGGVLRIDITRRFERFIRESLLPHLLQQGAKAVERGEMTRLKRERALQVRESGPQQPRPRPRHSPHVPSFGELRRMIDQRTEMVARRGHVAGLHRGLAPAQQEIHRRRAGLGQLKRDILCHGPRLSPLGLGQSREKPVKPHIATRHDGQGKHDCRGECRNGILEIESMNTHNRCEFSAHGRNANPRPINTKGVPMSDTIDAAVKSLNEKLDGKDFNGTAKFMIEGEGAVMVDDSGAHAGDEEADVTLTADAETFHSILGGDLDPTAAFMSGKLAVDGDMGMAMQLGAALS